MSSRKILIIGSKDFHAKNEDYIISSFGWNDLEYVKNVKDYDILIINLLQFENKKIVAWDNYSAYKNIFDFVNINEILFNYGSVIVLGDPRFLVKIDNNKYEPFLNWTAIDFTWDGLEGDSLTNERNYFSDYICSIKKWNYSLERCQVNLDELGNIYNIENFKKEYIKPIIKENVFVSNRYKNSILFSLQHQFVNEIHNTSVKESGHIYFFPNSSFSDIETIQYLLKQFFKITLTEEPPQWVKELKVANQDKLDLDLERVREEINILTNKEMSILKSISDLRNCIKLIYECDNSLESIVWETLGKLGAEIEEPIEKGFEDGWLKVLIDGEDYEGVLEIKSTTKENFDEKGRKQVLDWVSRGITNRLKTYKGIFVGNNLYKEHPSKRPLGFSDNWKKAAELGKICAIKTEHLYLVYYLNEMKLVDLTEFWKDVFNTNGIFDISKYETIAKEKGLNIFPEPSEK